MSNFISALINKVRGKNEDNAVPVKEVKKSPTAEEKMQYIKIVEEIDQMISTGELMGIRKKEAGHFISYYLGNKKVCNVSKESHPPRTFFLYSGANHVARELDAKGLRPFTKNEARQRGQDHAKAIYTGDDLEIIRSMVKAIK